ncbi:MAG TPA: alpha/beta hydrolase [Aquimonas sp.]|jgi:pimeloyl-ACP methyl ester carboxylesterase|nr:alpha/beta hydrolase [Aquimonas sp.]HRF53442.1 alpha/beta hydrolase [Aquimonas sp.]
MLTLVLLPGMDGTGLLFEGFVSALGRELEVRVIAYPSTGALGYAELESHVREALPTRGEYVVLGESFSGPIAISIAAPRPAGLVGVILCASFVSNPRPRFAPCRHVIGLLPITATPLAVLNAALLGRFTTPLLRSELAKAMAQVSSDALRARLQAVLSVDVSAHLKTIDVPVLYLLAKYDRVVPLDALEHLIRLHPATQVEPIEAPHFLLQAAPTAAATAVRGFLASLPKPSARIPDPRPSHRLRDDDLPAKLPKQGV